MTRHWTDQPAMLEDLPVLHHFRAGDHVIDIFKKSDTEWYITAGNLFGSQTVRCPSAEKVLECLALSERRNKANVPKVPEGCELLDNASKETPDARE